MARRQLTIIDLYASDLPFAIELRRLLQQIPHEDADSEIKSVMLTSAMLSEGKSTISSFLAVASLKQLKKKTLLLDADLRRPTIHKFFGLPRQEGLCELLTEARMIDEVIKNTSLEGLDIITAGRSNRHPSELFDPKLIGRIIDELKFTYDMIIVDCAPVLPVSDPMLLASSVDGVLLIVKAGATQKEVVQRAVEILDTNKTHILGVVLNNMNNSLPYYYDYKYYGYEQSEKTSPIEEEKRPSKRKNRKSNNKPVSLKNGKLPSDKVVK